MILVQHHYDEEDGALISRSRSAVDSRAVDLGRGWKKWKRNEERMEETKKKWRNEKEKNKENDANKKPRRKKKN